MLERRRRLRVIASWNAHVGRSIPTVVLSVRQLIRDTDADVVCLQEARRYVTALRLAFPGWRIYARGGWEDSQHNPVMARRSLQRGRRYRHGWGTVRVSAGWEYQGNPKPGRTWTWVLIDGVRVLSLHRVAGRRAAANAASYAEEAEQLREWFAEHDGPMVVIGDANESPTTTSEDSMLRIAREVKGSVIFDRVKPGIDYALARNLRGHLERINEYGSDHRAAVLTVSKEKS